MIKYNIKFNLYNRANADGTHAVRMRVTWAGNRLDQFLPIAIEPKYWDEGSVRVKSSYRPLGDLTASAHFNDIIAETRTKVERFFCYCEVNSLEAATYSLKDWLNPQKECLHTAPRLRMFTDIANECLSECSRENCWSESSIVHMKRTIKHLSDFNHEARLENVDESFLNDFVEYLFGLGHRNKTVHGELGYIKLVLKWSNNKDYPVNPTALHYSHKFKGTKSACSEIIYLTWEEMMQLRTYSFKHYRKLGQARDVFLFCCFSGLRYSDVAALKKADVSDGIIRVITQKTVKALDIELNQYTKEILDKYEKMDLHGKALPVPPMRSYNASLKKLTKMAGINAPTRKVYFVKSERFEEVHPKYELISSHCARRSFVVNALRLGIPAEVIMSWTGHSDFDSMRPYVKIVDEIKTTAMSKFDRVLGVPTLSQELSESPQRKKTVPIQNTHCPWRKSISHIKELKPAHKDQMITIMDELSKNEMVFQVDLAETLGLSVNTTHKRMQYLVDKGYIKCVGWGRKTRWKIL